MEKPVDQIICYPIGVIHTPFKKQADTPIQGVFAPDSRGTIELFPDYTGGLEEIPGFSHLILLYHFHLADAYSLYTAPFLDNGKKGIFAIRHFKRPNHIGLSVVRLLGVNNNILEIGEVDVVDGTPLLDIKPYVPQFDIRNDANDGWYKNATNRRDYEQNNGLPQRLDDFSQD